KKLLRKTLLRSDDRKNTEFLAIATCSSSYNLFYILGDKILITAYQDLAHIIIRFSLNCGGASSKHSAVYDK
ncbi:hypothetical protein L9F63_008481, partial [Diploptera punctata]